MKEEPKPSPSPPVKVPKKIIAAIKGDGGKPGKFLVKFMDGAIGTVDRIVANQSCPQLVIDFYQKSLVWNTPNAGTSN